MKKKIIILISILLIILIGVMLKLTVFKKVTTVITPSNNLDFEYNQEVYLLDTISIIDGIIIDQNFLLDTDSLGEKEITINYKNSNGWKKKYTYKYNVKDTTSPIFSIPKNTYIEVNADVNSILNKIFAGDNCDRKIDFTIEGDYNVSTVGNYDIKVIATDDSNNKTEKETTLHVYERKNTNNNNSNNTHVNEGTPLSYFIKNYRTTNTSFGLDLSTYQTVEDFNLVKEQGIDFVILRIGWGPNEDMTFNTDKKFEDFYQRAKEAGLKVGVYYFSYATTLDEVDLEVNYVLDMLKDKELDLPIAYDWENWNLFKDCNMNFTDLNKMAKKFMDKLKDKGYQVMNYSSKYYLENIWQTDEYDTWYAQYYKEATTTKKFKIWQISDEGKVEGVNNLVDINILYN